ncbi:MAG: hypothetical protein ACT4PV_09885 [Planctomycetaceae bacterium]
MSFLVLLRFYLRRHRAAFAAATILTFLHHIVFLAIFQFWKKNTALAKLFLSAVPQTIKDGFGIPMDDLGDPLTFEALYFLRPELRALLLLFGVTAGTAMLAGEVGSGTADLLFSHPVRRRSAVLATAAATALHMIALGFMLACGYLAGVAIFPMGPGQPTLAVIVPGIAIAVLGSLAIAYTTFLFGAACKSRPQAVGWSLALILVPMFLDFIGIFYTPVARLTVLFPEHWWRSHRVVASAAANPVLPLALRLGSIAVVSLLASAFLAERRDLSR